MTAPEPRDNTLLNLNGHHTVTHTYRKTRDNVELLRSLWGTELFRTIAQQGLHPNHIGDSKLISAAKPSKRYDRAHLYGRGRRGL